METIDKRTFGKLWKLMYRNTQVEKAYHNAAENMDNKKLIHCFRKRSEERKRFGESLRNEIMAAFPLGGDQKASMHISEIPILDNGASMLKIFARRDRSEVDKYGKILEVQNLPFEIYQLIRKHKMRIEVELFKVRDISDLH